jgi:hypothetical protein
MLDLSADPQLATSTGSASVNGSNIKRKMPSWIPNTTSIAAAVEGRGRIGGL